MTLLAGTDRNNVKVIVVNRPLAGANIFNTIRHIVVFLNKLSANGSDRATSLVLLAGSHTQNSTRYKAGTGWHEQTSFPKNW